MKHYAIIPARKNSVGLKNKNRILFKYTVNFLKKIRWFKKILLSTDDDFLIKKAQVQNYLIHKRSKKNSSSSTSIKSVIMEIKREFNFNKNDVIWLFYLTIPHRSKKDFLLHYKIYINTLCGILNFSGININTVPVLDVKRKKSHKIINTRSFSDSANRVSLLGSYCEKLFKENKIATVIKHIPGHGLATLDSHLSTPVVKSNKNELINKDFKAFKNSSSKFAMTAHIVYKVLDPKYTATHSSIIIKKIIRNHIKFRGLIISDDISMKALKFKLVDNAKKALEAGCNLVLHCNGNLNEMNKLVKVIPQIDKFTKKKTSDFYNFLM